MGWCKMVLTVVIKQRLQMWRHCSKMYRTWSTARHFSHYDQRASIQSGPLSNLFDTAQAPQLLARDFSRKSRA